MKSVMIAVLTILTATSALCKEVTLEFYLRAFNNVDGYTIIAEDINKDKLYLILHTTSETKKMVIWDKEVAIDDFKDNPLVKAMMKTGLPIEVYSCHPETRNDIRIENVDLTPIFDKGIIEFETPTLKETTPYGSIYTIHMYQ